MRPNKLSAILLASIFLIIPMVSAYSWGYYQGPLDYLDNEWVRFVIIVLIFFAIIYFVLMKTFDNKAVAAVVALGLSLFIALAMARRGMLYGYVGDELGSWILIIATLIGCAFLIRFAYDSFDNLGAIAAIIGIWYVLHIIDPYEIIPYALLTDQFITLYEFISGGFGGIVLIIATLIILNLLPQPTIKDIKDATDSQRVKRGPFRGFLRGRR